MIERIEYLLSTRYLDHPANYHTEPAAAILSIIREEVEKVENQNDPSLFQYGALRQEVVNLRDGFESCRATILKLLQEEGKR